MTSWGGAERYKEKKKIRFRDLVFDIPDSLSFVYQIKEIFGDEIYRFKSHSKEPLVIDCGANVGVSVIYFKKLYEKCKVCAFEADKKIFEYLEHNIKNNQINNVELHNKAIWIDSNGIYFESDGADGGYIKPDSTNQNSTNQRIDSISLKNILLQHNHIDFLKIDIEGAENEVLFDCRDSLCHIQNIFIEYHQRYNQAQNLGEIINILDKANFRIYLENITKNRFPFIQDSQNGEFELQVNIFGYKAN